MNFEVMVKALKEAGTYRGTVKDYTACHNNVPKI